MKAISTFGFVVAAGLACGTAVAAGPVGLDGSIGAEWSATTPTIATFNAAAPTSNFGAPTSENHVVGYEVFLREDTSWVYAAVRSTSMQDLSAVMFSNLYFSMRYGANLASSTGDGIGFEVTNDRAFKPGGAGPFNDTGGASGGLMQWATTPGTASQFAVIEVAIDRSVFEANALNVTGYTGAPGPNFLGLRLNLSQSFGYSVVGGASYGDSRLGLTPLAAVPETSTWAMMALGLAAVGAGARRARKG